MLDEPSLNWAMPFVCVESRQARRRCDTGTELNGETVLLAPVILELAQDAARDDDEKKDERGRDAEEDEMAMEESIHREHPQLDLEEGEDDGTEASSDVVPFSPQLAINGEGRNGADEGRDQKRAERIHAITSCFETLDPPRPCRPL